MQEINKAYSDKSAADGLIPSIWSEWFDQLSISTQGDQITRLKGANLDQAALHRILNNERFELNYPVIGSEVMRTHSPQIHAEVFIPGSKCR